MAATAKEKPVQPDANALPRMLEPILVDRASAAQALSMGESTFSREVAAGRAPKPRLITKGRVGWLWCELMAHARALPVADLLPPPNTGNRKGKGKGRKAANDEGPQFPA